METIIQEVPNGKRLVVGDREFHGPCNVCVRVADNAEPTLLDEVEPPEDTRTAYEKLSLAEKVEALRLYLGITEDQIVAVADEV